MTAQMLHISAEGVYKQTFIPSSLRIMEHCREGLKRVKLERRRRAGKLQLLGKTSHSDDNLTATMDVL